MPTIGGHKMVFVDRDGKVIDHVGKSIYLGEPVKRDGVPIMVKCNCPKQGGEVEVFLPAHKCDVLHRCLPSANMTAEQWVVWGERHESAFYALCQLCL